MSETTRDADMKIIPQPLSPDGKAWPETMDGMAWAVEFNQRFPAVSVDDALGWFCNAIMRGYDTATSRQSDALAAAQRENARLREELENIARANWRTWDPEMRSPDEFVSWAQSRATAALRGEGGA